VHAHDLARPGRSLGRLDEGRALRTVGDRAPAVGHAALDQAASQQSLEVGLATTGVQPLVGFAHGRVSYLGNVPQALNLRWRLDFPQLPEDWCSVYEVRARQKLAQAQIAGSRNRRQLESDASFA